MENDFFEAYFYLTNEGYKWISEPFQLAEYIDSLL